MSRKVPCHYPNYLLISTSLSIDYIENHFISATAPVFTHENIQGGGNKYSSYLINLRLTLTRKMDHWCTMSEDDTTAHERDQSN